MLGGEGTRPAVTLAEAQAYLRIDGGGEEAIVAGLIRSASALCEAFIGQVVVARDFTEEVPAVAVWQRLTLSPVRHIAAVETVAADGSAVALAASDFAVDIDAQGNGWVRATGVLPTLRLRVTATAGLASDRNAVPEPLRQGIVRLVGHLFASRDGAGGEPPAAVTALWRPYRRMRL